MKTIALILLLAIAFHTHAQEFSYKQFTTADGLPSNVVYGAYQDQDGYIWFCTNAGVSRFNGISFQNFSVEHGLSDNEVFGAFQTPSGRIWFRTFSTKLCYYENGTFHNSRTDPWLNKPFGGMKFAHVDDNGVVWTRNYVDSFVYVMDERKKSIEKIPWNYRDSAIIVTANGVDTVEWTGEYVVRSALDSFERTHKPIVNSLPDSKTYFMYLRTIVQSVKESRPDVPLDFIYHMFTSAGFFQRFRLYNLIYNFDKDGGSSDGYWVTHANKGILYGTNLMDLQETPTVYLPNKTVSNVMVDREGNYWFTTPTEGVFLLTAHGVKTFDPGQNESEIYSVTGNDEFVIAGKNNEVMFINRQTGKRINWRHNSLVYNRVKDLLIDSPDHCWVASDIGVVQLQFDKSNVRIAFNPATKNHYSYLTGAMKCMSIGTGKVYLGSHTMLYAIFPGYSVEQMAFKRITAVSEVTKDKVLVGSIDGLYQYSNKTLDTFHASNGTLSQHITDRKKNDDFIAVATNDAGLVLIRNNKLYHITAMDVPENLLSNICRKLFIDQSNNIWVSTNKGLCKVTVESWEPFRYDVQTYTTDDGLISNDVNAVFVSKDTVWAATSGGLSFFSIAGIKQKGLLPQIYISQADTLMNRSFSYRNKIVIGLEGLSYESLGKMRYRYRLKGLYQDWRNTDRNQLAYDVLPPGQYELEVYSINRFGQESAKPATVVFTVVPPWWQTNWAYAIYSIALISLLLTSLMLVRRTSRRKERNRMKHIQQLQQLELKALRSQMNPHFIFNTLNAVQKYILENDKEASYRYLTRFSKLIRGFLENSRQTTISLQHELDLLRSYMEMETLRFRNKFSYEIEIDPTLDTASVYIPSMLIQPYVENAIWHGIQHKKANGFVKLSVQDMGGNVLKCRILDNGIGRKKASEIESATGSQHQPVGMTITQQRLELINQRLKQAVSVNYIDIAEESNGAGTGTIVELIVTYLTKKP